MARELRGVAGVRYTGTVILELVDSHVHLDDAAFTTDLDAVLARARGAGVCGFVSIGTSVASSRRVVALAARHDDVYAAVAIHPHEAADATPEALAALADLAQHPHVVAVGETGLDWYRDFAPREAQVRALRAHLDLARRAGLPVIIHCREAYSDVLGILAEHPVGRVIMHCFSGPLDVARVCLDRGYYLGLGGPVTYRNARRALEVARYVPPDRLLLETDAPYLPPEPHRGRRNEPAYLPLIAWAVAHARGVAPGTVAEITTANARAAFGLPRPAVRD
ncbi:MAG: TatD family hydrolase [Armatimonadota bacterium]|nr:TatD family hydrolase [Armatimonadota bacterium]MDR7533240.1 TatD family hydrolase [Armatimonadota bacterium]MDR7536967.1 TatD family hydrolase [Armatimonadota bacterium]